MNSSRKPLESVTSFYDAIATVYESQLTDGDTAARAEIAAHFRRAIPGGTILDFGGGTGLDLAWLTASKYKIFFLEPSSKMRGVAQIKYQGQKSVTFLENELDFARWSGDKMPFAEKMNGVIANFAVLNCIGNVAVLFSSLALVCEKECHVFLTIIDPRFFSVLKNYSLRIALKLLLDGQVTILNRNGDVYHETHLQSLSQLRKSSEEHFAWHSVAPLASSVFMVVHLIKR